MTRLVESLRLGRCTLLTGVAGSGKSTTLRAVRTALAGTGERFAPLIVGSSPGAQIPLGAFAGVPELPAAALDSPAAVVAAFARHRSQSVLLVDDVDLLDEQSLFVVGQLICVTRLPALLTLHDLGAAPPSIQRLYDGGHLAEAVTEPLTDHEAGVLLRDLVEGDLTPRTQATLVAAAQGNPLHLREMVRGSVLDGRLTETPHGWELEGAPAPTARLSDLVGERFRGLSEATVEEATLLALAGEYPLEALGTAARQELARADVIEVTECGWARLSHPLDAEHLTSQCSSSLQHDLAHRAIEALRSVDADSRPDARRRADLLALEHGCDLDVAATVELAEYALGVSDERLAGLATGALVKMAADSADALRVEGLTASLLGDTATADACLEAAVEKAHTEAERTSVALARAQHLGLRRHDAVAALAELQHTLHEVSGAEHVADLQRASLRWATVAGQAYEPLPAPDDVDGVDAVSSLIVLAVSGVIAGPLHETTTMVSRVRSAPAGLVALIPDGELLLELVEIAALSFSGDILGTRARLEHVLASAREETPESLGIWEYALGFLEFLFADLERAYVLSRAAVSHLAWRDTTGLMPAAQALTAASATATGRSVEAHEAWSAIPEGAASDPRVVMLQAWADAWQASAERRPDQAAHLLLETAGWLLEAEHTYLAGMVAHCVARMARQTEAAATLLRSASDRAGGGLLHHFVRHAEAVGSQDVDEAESVAAEAQELGLVTTATDTWLWLADVDDRRRMSEGRSRRHRVAADEVRLEMPSMALWRPSPDRSTLLTERELRVTRLAVDRFSAKEIAGLHDVSVHTVTNQLASAFRKLGVSSRAELRDLFSR